MALNPFAAQALEKVEDNLLKLKGAMYFNDEEWYNIDFLIHKGQYVFTNGPPKNVAVEKVEDMIIFDNTNEKTDFSVQAPVITAFELEKDKLTVITESEILSPSASETANSLNGLVETPNITSAEASSDDEPAAHNSTAPASTIEFVKTPKRAPAQPANGGLSYYTQAQLDEGKAFNSGLTKAGQKTRGPRINRYVDEPDPSPSWDETAYPSPALSEDNNPAQIQSWASNVHPATPASGLAAPVPTKISSHPTIKHIETVKALARPSTARPSSLASHRSAKTNAPSPVKFQAGQIYIAQKDIEKTSAIRLEIKIGDSIQYHKPVSGQLHFGVNLRTDLKGQFPDDAFSAPFPQTSSGQNAATAAIGHIRAISSVSNGIDRVERSNAAEWDEVQTVSGLGNDKSASGWGNSPPSKPAVVAPSTSAPVKSPGLATTSWAEEVEEEEEEEDNGYCCEDPPMTKNHPPLTKNNPPLTKNNPPLTKKQTKQYVENPEPPLTQKQLAQVQAFMAALPRIPAKPRSVLSHKNKSRAEPLIKVKPKTEVCWWWYTPNKECRFTADECRDLHALVYDTAGTNLRMGKPSWGAAADYVPDSPTPTPSSAHVQADNDGWSTVGKVQPGSSFGPVKNKTCWYWQNEPKGCENSAENCKYLHQECAGGVADNPMAWKSKTWNRSNSFALLEGRSSGVWPVVGKEAEGGDDGEVKFTAEEGEEVKEATRGWGRPVEAHEWGSNNVPAENAEWGSEEKHIVNLEDKAVFDSCGW